MVADLCMPVEVRRRARPCARTAGWRCRRATSTSTTTAAAARARALPRPAAPGAGRPRGRRRRARRRARGAPRRARGRPRLPRAHLARPGRRRPRRARPGCSIAARVGSTRLIDNTAVAWASRPDATTRDQLMLRTMMKSKIHRATVTQADLHYVGSVTVDEDLLDAADLLPGELVHIVDITNGARLETYTIAGERGSGVIGINGAAARLVQPGDLVILIAYGQMETAEARDYQPRVVFVDADNKVVGTGSRPRRGAPRHGPGPRRHPRRRPVALPSGARPPPDPATLPARLAASHPGLVDVRRRRGDRLRHRRADRGAAGPRRPARCWWSPRTTCPPGSTQWAQGGIAAALGPGDTPEQHLHDTLVAGAGLCDERRRARPGHRGPGRRPRADRARHRLRPDRHRRAVADPRGRPPPRPDRARRRRRHRRRDPARARGAAVRAAPGHRGASSTPWCST